MREKRYLTKQQYEDMILRKKALEEVDLPNVADEISEARELGDLSENAEYNEAKEKQGKLNDELLIINDTLENCEIIQEKDFDGTVQIGRVVKLYFPKFNLTKTLTVIGEWDRRADTTSMDSPLGKAIIGRKKGETARYLSSKDELKVDILDVN